MRLNYTENAHLVLDVGLVLTKVGFSKESMPQHIFQTPLSTIQSPHNQYDQFIYTYQSQTYFSTSIRENLSKLKLASFAEAFSMDRHRLHLEVEEFLTSLFYHVLKTNPKDKSVVLCERLGGLRVLTEAIGYVLFKKFNVKAIYTLLSNALPLYATGLDTGIVVDCGYQQVEILPFCQSQVCIEGFEISDTGGVQIEKTLSKMIMTDSARALSKLIQHIPKY
jgi:actin-related protein